MAALARAASPYAHLEDPALVLGVYVVPVTAQLLVSDGRRGEPCTYAGYYIPPRRRPEWKGAS